MHCFCCMPVFYCSGAGCQRMISVSAIPGGNPTALAEPDKFAIVHRRCSGCGKRFCDRCMEKDELKSGSCAACGSPLADPPPDEALKIMFGQQSAEGAAATARLEPPPKRPWWKFWS